MSAGAGLIALLLAQAPAVFDTGVEAVYVDVFVSEKSGPVLGLRAEDFVVEDNGVRQRDEAALLTFGHKIELRHGPTTDRAAVAEALDRVVPGGGSAVIDTLYLCLKRRWGAGRPLVVLFTDGQDAGSWLENEDVLRAARGSSTLLFVVGTEAPSSRSTRPPNPWGFTTVEAEPGFVYLLRRAAETTGGAYWTADPSRLEAVFLKVLEAANARYVLSYEPQGVPRPGRHRLEVSVRRRGVKVRARQEYVAPAVAEGRDGS